MYIYYNNMMPDVQYWCKQTNAQYKTDGDGNLFWYNGAHWVLSCVRYNDLIQLTFQEI